MAEIDELTLSGDGAGRGPASNLTGPSTDKRSALPMIRTILTYGLVSGLVIIVSIVGTLWASGGDPPHSNAFVGYLIMLVALSSILVAIKQYRDQTLGGVIRFPTAALLGLGIAIVASLAYVAIWVVYLAVTDYRFMDQYIEATLSAKRAAGVTGPAYDKLAADLETMRQQYASPIFRLPMTFLEIFPVGLLITLVSAVLLRNPRFLPARALAR
jgi:hypothetical protein